MAPTSKQRGVLKGMMAGATLTVVVLPCDPKLVRLNVRLVDGTVGVKCHEKERAQEGSVSVADDR
jgi:hypothetical protein